MQSALLLGVQKLFVLAAVLGEEVIHQRRDIFLAIAQRRQRQIDHVQPVVQILAELAFFHQPLQIGVGGGDDAHVHLDGFGRPQRHELALLNHAQQLGLRLGTMVPISSKKMVPRFAISKYPLRDAMAPVKAPLTWPNSADSSRSDGTDPLFTGTNG